MSLSHIGLFRKESEDYLKSLDKKYTRLKGIAYTPEWAARHITRTAFKQWSKFNRGKAPKSACDLCCGTGVFINEMISEIESSGTNANTTVTAFDIDTEALKIANYFLSSHPNVAKIEEKNTLLDINSILDDGYEGYDIIVGNPPYVNHRLLDIEYKRFLIKNYYCASSGVFDLSVVFVEKVLKSLNPGGVASLILSNKFMTSKYGRFVCDLLSSKCNILKIEDFNDLQLFKGLTTYTCILTFINAKPAKRHTLARAIYETKNIVNSMPKMTEETISHESLLYHPWNFHTMEGASIHKKLNSVNTYSIYDVFDGIQQGIRTGANDVFIINKAEKDRLNSELVRNFVSGENIIGIEVSTSEQFVIYPYEFNGSKYIQISEEKLKNEHSSVFEYLHQKKSILRYRSLQGKTNWYEFSRSQSLDSINKRKIFVREMMPSALFSADIEGQYAFSSGYALICESLDRDDTLAWSAILSTPVMEFSMRHVGTQLHSGWFRLMKNHLDQLRLPAINPSQLQSIKNLIQNGEKHLQREINKLIADSFMLTRGEVQYIDAVLEKIHDKSMPNDKNIKKSIDNQYEPVKLSMYNKKHIDKNELRQAVTFNGNKKRPIHNWYKYTQGFSSSLVNYLLDEYSVKQDDVVLDPFNGCGTTVLTCTYRGINSIGIEISPLMCEVTRIKCRSWSLDKLRIALDLKCLIRKNISDNVELIFKEYFDKAYSTNILNSLIQLSANIKDTNDNEIRDFYTIGLLSILEDISKVRKHGSHYRFLNNSSSVGLQKLNINVIDDNANIENILAIKLKTIYDDICSTGGKPTGKVEIINESSLNTSLRSNTVDYIITSPPYLNRNNYIAQQKAELDLFGMIKTKSEYKALVKKTFRSHTDSELSSEITSYHSDVNLIIKNIKLEEANNPKIPHMICGYFDDLESALKESYRLLKKGGKAAFVVGNVRWGGVVVPIDHILAKMAENIGFNIDSIFITRLKGNSPQQMKKYGKIPVRESIVNLYKK